MTKAKYQLALCAAALDGEGNPVHPGLRDECISSKIKTTGPNTAVYIHDGECSCGGPGFIPNPDPMAMIAACQKQDMWLEFVVLGGKYAVMVYDSARGLIYTGYGSDNPTALTDVFFQATATRAANWEDCPGRVARMGPRQDSITHRDYPDQPRWGCTCYDTGKVLKRP